MTDAEQDEAVARVDTLTDIWLPLLGLKNMWRVTFHMYRDSGEYASEESGPSLADGDVSVARTHVLWPYLTAHVHINLSQFVLHDEDDQEEMVVHELCHILIAEMRDARGCNCDTYVMSHEERVCTILSHAFVRTRNESLAQSVASNPAPGPGERDPNV